MQRVLLGLCVAVTICMQSGCNRLSDTLDEHWTPPVAVAQSIGGLGGVWLHKYQNTLLGVQVLMDGEANLLLWNSAGNSWSQTHISSTPKEYLWGGAAIDLESGQVILPNGYVENERLVMNILIGTITERGNLRDVTERSWITGKKALLGETSADTRMNAPGMIYPLGVGLGIASGPEVYIPFSLHAETYVETPVKYQGKTLYRKTFETGPFNNGVFHSTDSGRTWKLETVSSSHTRGPIMRKTKGHYYYFGIQYPINGNGLWASRKSVSGGTWEEPKMLASSFAIANGYLDVAGEDDTAHFCWMDLRHNKGRFNFNGPRIENNDIYYRRRSDSDQEWSKEVWLSKGLLYAYAPTISAEGNNVVAVWAGIQDADKQHTEMDPNDIYFVTSKDAGRTWTAPVRVTDGAKDGITTGMPRVALLNGVIHLLYTQGTLKSPTELSPGLTRLGSSPWPIYYTQRPFPE